MKHAAQVVDIFKSRYDDIRMARQTVLIVEDDLALRRMFRTALSYAGYNVQEAADGLVALQIIDQAPPDAVILDLGLPIVSGHVVRQEITAQSHTRNISVLVVTGMPGDHSDLNAACVLKKPVSPDRLVAEVQRCLAAGQKGSVV